MPDLAATGGDLSSRKTLCSPNGRPSREGELPARGEGASVPQSEAFFASAQV